MSQPIEHKALRPIAVFEALKGLVGLIAGLVALGFLDRDNEVFATQIIRFVHLDAAWHYAQIFIRTMADLDDSYILAFGVLAAFYAALRFAEAYGLWNERRWAEWLAALSGGIYIPFEIYELVKHVTWLRLTALGLNVVIVSYLAWLLVETRRRRLKPSAPN